MARGASQRHRKIAPEPCEHGVGPFRSDDHQVQVAVALKPGQPAGQVPAAPRGGDQLQIRAGALGDGDGPLLNPTSSRGLVEDAGDTLEVTTLLTVDRGDRDGVCPPGK